MHFYLALFLVALSTLAYEIALTRLLSVVSWYHLSFLAISVAMLGMTVGAIVVFLADRHFRSDRLHATLRGVLYAFAISLPLAVYAICEWTFPSVTSFSGAASTVPAMAIIILAAAIPFLLSGVFISAALTRYPLPINRLYAADLLGAASGCLVILLAMSWLDTPTSIILAAVLPLVAVGLVHESPSPRASLLALVAGVAVSAALVVYGPLLSPQVVKGKQVVEERLDIERWNSHSRVEVHKPRVGNPALWGASQGLVGDMQVHRRGMNIDGEAGTNMYRFLDTQDIEHLQYDVTSIVHVLRDDARVAVVGVGGGKDLQVALWFEQASVTGIELNAIFVDLLQDDLKEYAGLADRPELTLVVDEARSWLSASPEQFDILQMSLIDTCAATGAGAFSLSENGLYTVEAWHTFMDRLSERGIFTVSRWFAEGDLGETGRMVSLAVAVLLERGISEPARHIALVTNGFVATLLVGRAPFIESDLERLQERSAYYGHGVAVLPGRTPAHPLLARVLQARTPAELETVAASSSLNIAPPTDQSPYFFNMLKLGGLAEGRSRGLLNSGVLTGNIAATYTLLSLIAALLALSLPLIFGPVWLAGRVSGAATVRLPLVPGCFFALIGTGFMAVEMGLLQYLSVFLGHPVYGLGILLFAVIASTGVGSLFSDRLPLARRGGMIALVSLTLLSTVLAYLLLSRYLSDWIVLSIPLKALISIAIIAPLGLLMGCYFPTAMNLVRGRHEAAMPWFWALNGFFGVLAAALATFLAIYVGIWVNFLIGLVCYALTLPCLFRLGREESVSA